MMMTSRALMSAVSSVIEDRSGFALAPAEQPAEDEDSTESDVRGPYAALVQQDERAERAHREHDDRRERDECGEQAVDDRARGDSGWYDRAIARHGDRVLDQIGGFGRPVRHSGPLLRRERRFGSAAYMPGRARDRGGSGSRRSACEGLRRAFGR